MSIRVSVDVTQAVAGLHELQKSQIPFALAKTLTKTAQDAQGAVRETLPGKFTLRNRFTNSGIRFKPAEKNSDRIEAQVFTRTANDRTGAPGYMERQEEGGEKVPVGGRQHLAIPTKYLRKYAGNTIPDELRPRFLLGPNTEEGFQYYRPALRGKNKLGKTAAKALAKGWTAFIKPATSSTLCIFVRLNGTRDIEPWYILIPSATIKERLEMRKTVQAKAAAVFPVRWRETWYGEQGILTKGLRVKF